MSDSLMIRVNGEWGEFFIAEREPVLRPDGHYRYSATWTCLSSFGVFGHYWHDMGEPFSKFIQDIDAGYLLGKIAKKETVPELAIGAIKQEVLSQRKERYITKDTAREAWNEIESIADEGASGEVTCHLLYHSSELSFINDWDFSTRDFCGDAKQFVKKIWPEFVNAMKLSQVPQDPADIAANLTAEGT
jgi:hypothetical protein